MRKSTIVYFVGNDTGMNSAAELNAEVRFGIVGVGWQMHMRGSNWSHLEQWEEATAAQLKAVDPDVKVLVTRNTQAGVSMLDSVRPQLLSPTSPTFWITEQEGGAGCKTGPLPGTPAAVGQRCNAYWGCDQCGPGNSTTCPINGGAYWNFTDATFVEWWHSTLMAPILASRNIDGYYYDGAGGWPGIAPADAAHFVNASAAVLAKTLADTKVAKKMAIDWGSGYINPEDCNEFMASITSNPWTNATLQLTWVHYGWFEVTLATFLVGRGENSLLAFGLHGAYMCASEPCGKPNSPAAGYQAFPWMPILDVDFGVPVERGHNASSGVWSRRWSKASATVDCNTFSGSVTLDPVHTTPIPFNSSGASVPTAAYVDWNLSLAELVTSTLPGRSMDIRSGNPHASTVAFTTARIGGAGRALSTVAFTYRFGAGYAAGAAPANFTAALCAGDDIVPTGLAACHIIYTSPPLDEYTLPNYSPPVHVTATSLQGVLTDEPLALALFFDNNARNVQLGLPAGIGLNVTVEWGTNSTRTAH